MKQCSITHRIFQEYFKIFNDSITNIISEIRKIYLISMNFFFSYSIQFIASFNTSFTQITIQRHLVYISCIARSNNPIPQSWKMLFVCRISTNIINFLFSLRIFIEWELSILFWNIRMTPKICNIQTKNLFTT